jgi:hypothetical protein
MALPGNSIPGLEYGLMDRWGDPLYPQQKTYNYLVDKKRNEFRTYCSMPSIIHSYDSTL